MAFEYQGFASLGVNLNRQKYGPLDISNVFTSENDLKYYLTKGAYTEGVSDYWTATVPYPYEGQVLATVIDGVVNVYVLTLDTESTEGYFTTQEIASKIEVDGKTVKLSAEGKLELVGLPTDVTGKTLVPSLVNGELTWAEPDTSTAEGQATEIEGLKARATALESTVNGKAESAEGAGDAVVGLVDKVAANSQAIAEEVAAREAAIGVASQPESSEGAGDAVEATGVYAAIEAAEARVKAYADEQDADTIYDDSDLQTRVKAIEDDYLKSADKYDDTEVRNLIADLDTAVGDTESGLVKDVADNKTAIEAESERATKAEEALGQRIDAIDFVNDDELATAIQGAKDYTDAEIDKIEEAIAGLNHFKTEIVESTDAVIETGVLYLIKDDSVEGVDKYNEYIVVDGAPVLIGDTTTNLSDYYNKVEVDEKVDAVETAIAGESGAREALAARVTTLEAADNVTQEELDTYKDEVTSAIATAKSEAISDADSKLANKVNASDFEQFKTDNTSAIATAKQEAIAAAAEAEEAKGYAVASDVEFTYATKAELTTAIEGIENDLLEYTTTEALNTALEAKADAEDVYTKAEVDAKIGTPGTPAQGEEGEDGYVAAVPGTGVYQHVYSKDEVTDLIADITGGESAADVLAALNAYKTTNDTRVKAVEDKNTEQDTAIEAAQTQADKGVADAAVIAADLVTANAAITKNAGDIAVVDSKISDVNTNLSNEITALKDNDTVLEGDIAALQTTVSGENGHASRIAALEELTTSLGSEDAKLAEQIAAKANSADVYTKAETETKISDAIAAIPAVDLTPYAKTEVVDALLLAKADADNVYTIVQADEKFQTQDQVDARINTLIAASDPEGDGNTITNIQNLVEYVENNAGDIAALITTVNSHTDAIAALVQPKASVEVTVAGDGTLGLGEVSTDKLVNGSQTLVLNGGRAIETV